MEEELNKSRKIIHESTVNETQLAQKELLEHKKRMAAELEERLQKEREFLKELPNEINKRIQGTMEMELQRMRQEVQNGTDVLRDQIFSLRQQAIELEEQKKLAKNEVYKLRSNLAKVQYDDELRTHELLEAIASENHNRILPTSSFFSMPEPLFIENTRHSLAHKEQEYPLSYYDRERAVKGEQKLYNDAFFEIDAEITG